MSDEDARGSSDLAACADLELWRLTSDELTQQVEDFKNRSHAKSQDSKRRDGLVHGIFHDDTPHNHSAEPAPKRRSRKKGAFAGVFVPTCENMWGVLIFLRFYFIVGYAGVGQALLACFLSFTCAFCTTSSMVATVSSGGVVSRGGPYYMISRALGPVVGATVGLMHWMAITMLAVLETLGAVEAIVMASSGAYFPGCAQAYGSGIIALLVLTVWGGINIVSKMGVAFMFVVFATLFMFFFGLCTAPAIDSAMDNPWISGLSFDTLKSNWAPKYGISESAGEVNFGVVVSVFFPCFTGILSGAHRADILRDPPKNLRQGTFGAIIVSLFMYTSYFILWGMVADYRYLQGEVFPTQIINRTFAPLRRLSGAGSAGGRIVDEIVWNPFPKAAVVGIIVSSISQALQCLCVAPRLLQSIAKDEILVVLKPLAPLSKRGEPVRALAATYIFAGLLVLIGNLNIVAPLLSMCFLVAYTFMNFSCFALTQLKSPAWRPKGIHRRRWRIWYSIMSGCGTLICVSIMLIINPFWALGAFVIGACIYGFVSWKIQTKRWGSAMDGIRYQLALNALIHLEMKVQHDVNWRPQVLVLYKIDLMKELAGISHHEILRFYKMLRKSKGFCVVACVLEGRVNDPHAFRVAKKEKGVIQSIMREEGIKGFAEVVVSPTWVEGTNYIIQLVGLGGISPNTVLLEWPLNWRKHPQRALDFVKILRTSLSTNKALLAVKGLRHMPAEDQDIHGTIDIWWMLHDGGLLIVLAWLLTHYRTWRTCHLRVFTITHGITREKCQAAAEHLTRRLRQRRLFDVDVEVILADDEIVEPYLFAKDWRGRDRKAFLQQQAKKGAQLRTEVVPMEISELLRQQSEENLTLDVKPHSHKPPEDADEGETPQIRVVDERNVSRIPAVSSTPIGPLAYVGPEVACAGSTSPPPELSVVLSQNADIHENAAQVTSGESLHSLFDQVDDEGKTDAFQKLNKIIIARSKRAQLVVTNLPDLRNDSDAESFRFVSFCETLATGLERVLFVHSTDHEVCDIS